MNPNDIPTILNYLLGTTGLAGVVMTIRAWVRGRKEDEDLEADLQDKITGLADKWLDKAEKRLEKAEERAEAAERKMGELRKEFDAYKWEKRKEMSQMIGELQTVYLWIESGANPPPPSWPSWLPHPRKKRENG